MAFEKPVVIPSAFAAFRVGSAMIVGELGIRLSFPVYARGDGS